MSKKAWSYVFIIYLLGFASWISISDITNIPSESWIVFLVLTILATGWQLFKAEAPTHQLYHPSYVFFFAGLMVLSPFQFGLLIIISHLIEWGKERITGSEHLRDWYIQPFNIAMHLLVGFFAYRVYFFLNPEPLPLATTTGFIAATVAAIVYAFMNHAIIGMVLMLARNISFRESNTLDPENISMDVVMLVMGYISAILIGIGHLLVIAIMAPLFYINRALVVPALKVKANTDPKTGLWNAEYFLTSLDAELNRSQRFGRPMTVVMADLDLLRNINNVYGHLGGDAVLIGVADLLKKMVRDYDVVARFGGEEFSILMPEIGAAEALDRINQIRLAVEAAEFTSPTSGSKIKATMSFGLADLNNEQRITKDIVHHADVAVYQSKVNGRNRITIYQEGDAERLGFPTEAEYMEARNQAPVPE